MARAVQNEGHFPYDFGANSTMTNANVDTVVTANNGRELKLSYKGGKPGGDRTGKRAGRNLLLPATRADLTAAEGIRAHDSDQKAVPLRRMCFLVEKDGVVPPI